MNKFIKAIKGLWLLLAHTKTFHPDFFRGKRVAIIGSADSLFKQEKGAYIDRFEVVVRINKALYRWNPDNERYTGSKTDILFHSMYENTESGGGPLDFSLFSRFRLGYVVNTKNSYKGWRLQFNFYKKYLSAQPIYMMNRQVYKQCMQFFPPHKIPTIGFFALYYAIISEPKHLYITGFTFFKTAYGKGYRDHFIDIKTNNQFIASQGLHDPELEFKLFCKLYRQYASNISIELDDTLQQLVNEQL